MNDDPRFTIITCAMQAFWSKVAATICSDAVSAEAEHVNTRTNVGIQDISSMGEVDEEGKQNA